MTKWRTNRRIFIILGGVFLAAPSIARTATLSALDYGIHPNSSRNQTSAFQQMLDDAARLNKIADVPSGRFIVNGLRLPDGCILRGSGVNTVMQSDRAQPILYAADASRIIVSGLSVESTDHFSGRENSGAIDFRNVSNATLANLQVRGGVSDGIYLERCGGNIEFCRVTRSPRFGIFAVQSAGLTIGSNSVSTCGNGGIIVHRWAPGTDGTTVARNEISDISATRGGLGQWGNGINIFKANGVSVAQNTIRNCAFSAIRMNSAHNTDITDNRCLNSGETAIYAEFAYRDVVITGNEIDGAANGISATNLNEGGRGSLILNNRIKDLIAPGPYSPEPPFFGHGISVEADGIVRNNTIQNANGYGINVGWGPYLDNVEVSENLISGANIGIGISIADGAGQARILRNSIAARQGAIRAHRWADIVPGDLIGKRNSLPNNIRLDGNVRI